MSKRIYDTPHGRWPGGTFALRAQQTGESSPTKLHSTEIRPTPTKTCLGCGAKFTTIPEGGLPCGH